MCASHACDNTDRYIKMSSPRHPNDSPAGRGANAELALLPSSSDPHKMADTSSHHTKTDAPLSSLIAARDFTSRHRYTPLFTRRPPLIMRCFTAALLVTPACARLGVEGRRRRDQLPARQSTFEEPSATSRSTCTPSMRHHERFCDIQKGDSEKLVGWYTTGPKIRPGDLQIDALVRRSRPTR